MTDEGDRSVDDLIAEAFDGEDDAEERKEGTFIVTAADEESAVLRDVADGQVHTLSTNPGVSLGEAVTATVAPDPPLNVSWRVEAIERQWTVSVQRGDESPTTKSREMAEEHAIGELARMERAGVGEIHVLTVPPERTEDAVGDIVEDEATVARAARLGVDRVEVRWDADAGIVSVRYTP